MVGVDDIVITGIGIVTPIGIGRTEFEASLIDGVCGSKVAFHAADGSSILVSATVDDFDGKLYVTPRKALKLMSREVQLAYAAAHLAWEDAGLVDTKPEPQRVGVVFGSEVFVGDHAELSEAIQACCVNGVIDHRLWAANLSKVYPLWMLRSLPNMPACHVAIAVDARGPNNTIVVEEAGGILALGEAMGIMQRGRADLMIVGALGSRATPTRLVYRWPGAYFDGASSGAPTEFHSRPFDASRCGIVPAEASVSLVLEKRSHAVARNAQIYGQLLSVSSRCGQPEHELRGSSQAIALAGQAALRTAGVDASDLATVSAQGFSQQQLDRTEARAIAETAPGVPVSAYSSYFGTAGAASGLANLTAALLSTRRRELLPVLGNEQTDADCPIQVCRQKQTTEKSLLLQLAYTFAGQAAAAVVEC